MAHAPHERQHVEVGVGSERQDSFLSLACSDLEREIDCLYIPDAIESHGYLHGLSCRRQHPMFREKQRDEKEGADERKLPASRPGFCLFLAV